jgi:hypothetical protein
MAKSAKGTKEKPVEVNPYPFYAARFWHGMPSGSWLKLLKRNGFRVGITKLGLAATISGASVFNSLFRPCQGVFYDRYIERMQIKDAPLFVLGHWRSGTTLLHELLVLDQRYVFPTSYECLAPNHFLISKAYITKLKFLIPKKRPMDDMDFGWDRPQEDEFALCNMGLPSPYLNMAFPNEPPKHLEYLTMEGLSQEELNRWKAGLEWFLKRVTFRDPKRIILKSPPHTGRIKTLLEVFPDARFVHIVRNPYSVFGSTVRLWKTLYKFQALQDANCRGLEEFVYSCFERMYAAFDRDRHLIDPARLVEIRYEDLVANPIEQMRSLYEHLKLGEFEQALPKLQAYFQDRQDYRTGKYQIEESVRHEIDRRWGPYMRRFGYCESVSSQAAG